MKVGDIVSLERWDATEPPKKRLGECRVTAIRNEQSQSGVVADVVNSRGVAHKGLDIAWLMPIVTAEEDE